MMPYINEHVNTAKFVPLSHLSHYENPASTDAGQKGEVKDARILLQSLTTYGSRPKNQARKIHI